MITGKKEDKSINFLQPAGSSESVVVTSLNWFTTIGKNLLIVVQIVALVAFGYRLIKDGQNNDLTSEVNRQMDILENDSWKQNTKRYENLQNLVLDIEALQQDQVLNSSTFSEVMSMIPLTLNIESISFNSGKVSISLNTTDMGALKNYEDAIKNNQSYSDPRFSISQEADGLDVSVSFTVIQEQK